MIFWQPLVNVFSIRHWFASSLLFLADMGAYPHKSMYKDLVDYELLLPTKYEVQMKDFCLYHQKGFDKFSDEQQQKLIDRHGNALKIIKA
jgi:hypothetical protein